MNTTNMAFAAHRFSRKWLSLLCAAILVSISPGCDDSSGPGSGEGEIRVQMVDAPANVEAVVIAVSRIEVHTAGSSEAEGWVTISDQPATYDLLSLRNGSTALVASAKLKAAHYTQIRLVLGAGSYVVVNGVPVSLGIASGFETGVKLTHQFTIQEDHTYEITLDFDAEASLKPSGLGFRLQPVIRIYVNETSGQLSGTVLPAEARAKVTAMMGSDTVSTTVCDTTGFFKFAVIPEGTYSVGMSATVGGYRDTVLSNIAVTRRQETSIDTVALVLGISP